MDSSNIDRIVMAISNKTQAAEARKCKDTILNGIKQMGTNIVKVINSEITVVSDHADMLNKQCWTL